MFDLSGKVALVTGSSRGIGRSIAHTMARLGAKVVVSSRKPEACDAVVAEITGEGGAAVAVPCNIGRREELEALVAAARKAYGRIDVLVCNAATNPVFGPMHEVSDEAYDKIMTTNVKSAFWLANMVAPEMAERRDGSIILISSIASFYGNKKLGIYGVSKAAEQQLVRNLAVEWGHANVRVNAIAPGLIRTDFARALWEDEDRLAKVNQLTPLGRIGDPDDIGGVAAFLASSVAAYVTGQTIVADGGRTIGDPGA
jgi:dehydrogenase/reductase SDR family protein 4